MKNLREKCLPIILRFQIVEVLLIAKTAKISIEVCEFLFCNCVCMCFESYVHKSMFLYWLILCSATTNWHFLLYLLRGVELKSLEFWRKN